MKYPAVFTSSEAGRVVVKFRDIPEALTQGDNEQEALEMAQDALLTAMDFYFEDGRSVPLPSAPQEGEKLISLPLSIAAKVLLLNRMLEDRVRPADLARLMGVKPQEISRLMDLSHATKIDTVAQAMEVMGHELHLVAA